MIKLSDKYNLNNKIFNFKHSIKIYNFQLLGTMENHLRYVISYLLIGSHYRRYRVTQIHLYI